MAAQARIALKTRTQTHTRRAAELAPNMLWRKKIDVKSRRLKSLGQKQALVVTRYELIAEILQLSFGGRIDGLRANACNPFMYGLSSR